MRALCDAISELPAQATIEVSLLRVPDEGEVAAIAERALELVRHGQPIEEEFRELAIIGANRASPGIVEVGRYHERIGPALAMARSVITGGKPEKHALVRVPASDFRAVEALEHEAKQLPKSASAIVMLGVNSVPSAMKYWPALLLRRFQPTLNTRVSATCLFMAASSLTPVGEGTVPETKVLANPHAALPAPNWLLEQLERTRGKPFGTELGEPMRPAGSG
jgi:hypothetical protein